jgi:ribosomal protein L32
MAVPKKRVSKTRGSLRHTNWKKEIIPQALIALSLGKRKTNLPTPETSVSLRDTVDGQGLES